MKETMMFDEDEKGGTVPAVSETGAVVPAAQAPSIVSVLQTAVERGNMDASGLETLAKLVREEEDRAAKREFAAALAEFQEQCPPVPKTKHVDFVTNTGQRVQYSYPELHSIASHVGPALHARGFSWSWDNKIEGDECESVCTLRHKNGHQATAHFVAPIDRSGRNKLQSPAQQNKSAMTFANRCSFGMVIGLTEIDADDDARIQDAAPADSITAEQAAALRAQLGKAKVSEHDFCKHAAGFLGFEMESVDELPARDFANAMDSLAERARAS